MVVSQAADIERRYEQLLDEKDTSSERHLKENEKKIMQMLEQLGGQALREGSIDRGGEKIRIPNTMSLLAAEKFLRQMRKAEEETMEFQRTFQYRPWDGAFCMWNALKRVFGAVSHEEAIRMGFFGPEKEAPRFIDIACGVNQVTQVPWGALRIPALPDVLFTLDSTGSKESGPLFHVTAEGPRKHRAKVEGVFKLIDEELKERSLYRGKAIDGQTAPSFVDLSAVDPNKVVYSADTQEQLQANVWTPITHAAQLARLGLPRKRSVLLHGSWGTGKTLAAYLTAQKATDRGWTFLRARPGVDDLNQVMQTAKLYAPAVVFFEDIDVISDASKLDGDEASELLDSFDGMAAKGNEIMAVMTTNHIERIHQGMVRPGRLDAVIELGALDGPGVVELLLRTIPGTLVDHDDVKANGDQVAKAYEDYTPAYVTEAAGRAIRYTIHRSNGHTLINHHDLILAADGLRNQFRIMQDASHTIEQPTLDKELHEVARRGAEEAIGKLAKSMGWELEEAKK